MINLAISSVPVSVSYNSKEKNNYSSKNINFGMNTSKSTIKLFKRASASLVETEGDLPIVKKALEKLATLKTRKDGLILNIKSEFDNRDLSFVAPFVKNQKVKDFYPMDNYLNIDKRCYDSKDGKSLGQFFSDLVDSLASEEFKNNVVKRLDDLSEYFAQETKAAKNERRLLESRMKMEEVQEKITSLFFEGAVEVAENGRERYIPGPIVGISETFGPFFEDLFNIGMNKRQIQEKQELKKFINNIF